MALFELSAHPLQSYARTHSVLHQLDAVISTMHLTEMDINDPLVTTFAPGEVPRLHQDSFYPFQAQQQVFSGDRLLLPLPVTPDNVDSISRSMSPLHRTRGHSHPHAHTHIAPRLAYKL